jgi:hypothetical protein
MIFDCRRWLAGHSTNPLVLRHLAEEREYLLAEESSQPIGWFQCAIAEGVGCDLLDL